MTEHTRMAGDTGMTGETGMTGDTGITEDTGKGENYATDGESTEFGFHPAVFDGSLRRSESGSAKAISTRTGPKGLRKRFTGLAVIVGALTALAGGYSLLAPASGASDTTSSAADIQAGKLLYVSCITCHGANLEGVYNRGPSLIGTGTAATYFQVVTGRMPAIGQGAYEPRKTAQFTEQQTRELAAYVGTFGNGPAAPAASANLRTTTDAQLAEGGTLFRLNCASCHNFAGKGGALSAGKVAPGLNLATDAQLYTAMQSGPENMPVFSDNQITPDQKREIITYIQTLKAQKDPGGAGLDRIGPVSEGLLIWVVGLGVLMGAILWIGAKS